MFKNPGSLSNGVGNGNGMIDTRASFNSHMHDTNGGNADCGLWFNFEDEKGVLLYDCYTHDVIKIGTTAVDSETKDYTSVADKSITIIDTVKYQNFTNGKKCKLVGILMDKATYEYKQINRLYQEVCEKRREKEKLKACKVIGLSVLFVIGILMMIAGYYSGDEDSIFYLIGLGFIVAGVWIPIVNSNKKDKK